MKIHTVNQSFFREQLENSKVDLIVSDLSEKEKLEIIYMQDAFREYLGISESSKKQKAQITTEKILEKLSDKMNSDLKVIPLRIWIKIQCMCWGVRKCYCEQSENHGKVKAIDLVDTSLKVYKQADKDFYLAAKKILESRDTLIYLNNLGVNNHFKCAALHQNFVACSYSGKQTYSNFSHELQHGVDDVMFTNIYPFYKELAPIFFESLSNDAIGKKLGFAGLYDDRIASHNELMNSIFEYVRLLKAFDVNGRHLTLRNASAVLGVSTFKELADLYQVIMNDDFIDGVNYILSFMKAIELREAYYNGKNVAIKKLIAAVTGEERNINFQAISQSYERFLSELDGKTSKQKSRSTWHQA